MRMWMTLAISSVLMAATAGCMQPAAHAKLGWVQPSGKDAAAKAAGAAQDALNARDPILALAQAEIAVRLSPNQPVLRALLGRAYIANGRYGSAETAFGDAQTLDATMERVTVIKALAELGQGKTDAALATLDTIAPDRADAEAGLALMLAGRREAGLKILEAAARAPGADARARQNLALGFALQGRWNDAAATAARDVPADQVADRLHRWAQIAAGNSNPAQQVAALLGVNAAEDPGLPSALALIKTEPAVQVAEAAPAPAVVEPAPAPEPVVMAEQQTAPVEAVAPAPIMHVAAIEKARVAAPALLAKPRIKPVYAFAPKSAPKPRIVRAGGYVVQLGAFASVHRSEVAWGRMSGKAAFLAGYTPSGSGLRVGKATLFRLAVSGIATRAEAAKLCGRIKANGGDCFVRTSANDRPLEWALRRQDGERA